MAYVYTHTTRGHEASITAEPRGGKAETHIFLQVRDESLEMTFDEVRTLITELRRLLPDGGDNIGAKTTTGRSAFG